MGVGWEGWRGGGGGGEPWDPPSFTGKGHNPRLLTQVPDSSAGSALDRKARQGIFYISFSPRVKFHYRQVPVQFSTSYVIRTAPLLENTCVRVCVCVCVCVCVLITVRHNVHRHHTRFIRDREQGDQVFGNISSQRSHP